MRLLTLVGRLVAIVEDTDDTNVACINSVGYTVVKSVIATMFVFAMLCTSIGVKEAWLCYAESSLVRSILRRCSSVRVWDEREGL
jgi:hypothetical protein